MTQVMKKSSSHSEYMSYCGPEIDTLEEKVRNNAHIVRKIHMAKHDILG